MIELQKNINGTILDIGGGGEGVISGIYGEAVTAIDCRKEELDEIPYQCRKIVMDASKLDFLGASFQNVTAFYSFMFIKKEKHKDVIKEAYRALIQGGNFYIWDTRIAERAEMPFIKDLDINANGKQIKTTYGVSKNRPQQSAAYFKMLCYNAGFLLVANEESKDDFYQHWAKPLAD